MPTGFTSIKIESKERALLDAQRYSKDEQTLYTVIQCFKTDGFYVVEGTGDMIRNFETIVASYDKGKKIKL